MRPSAFDTTFHSQGEEVTSEEEDDIDMAAEIDAFLHHLPFWDFLDYFKLQRSFADNIPRYTIQIDSFHVTVNKDDSLGTFVDRLYSSGYPGKRMSHLDMILRLGREEKVSNSYFLEAVVREANGREVEILDWLADYIPPHRYGARALGTAAYRNHFEAVKMLLERVVDPNDSISNPHPVRHCGCKISVINYAQLLRFDEPGPGASDEMVAYLLGEGAENTTGVDNCLLSLLGCVLRHHEYFGNNLLANVQPIVERIRGFPNIVSKMEAPLETYILELDQTFTLFWKERRTVMEYLLDQGEKNNTGSPLAALIISQDLPEVTLKTLDKTANINAYCSLLRSSPTPSTRMTRPLLDTVQYVSPLQAAAWRGKEKLIRVLLQNGADVNCPARGSGGVTPLQAFCQLGTGSPQGREKKLQIVKLLLEHQANVNAAPAWNLGLNALQAAALMSDTTVAGFLISHGADVNAPACKYGGGTALVVAARRGHADMVRLLLKAGAAMPAAGVTVSSFGDTYDDHRRILDLLHISATEMTALYGDNGVASRDYHEYEAEWADDPTYENKG